MKEKSSFLKDIEKAPTALTVYCCIMLFITLCVLVFTVQNSIIKGVNGLTVLLTPIALINFYALIQIWKQKLRGFYILAITIILKYIILYIDGDVTLKGIPMDLFHIIFTGYYIGVHKTFGKSIDKVLVKASKE